MAKVTMRFLKKQYPRLWKEVERLVADDLGYVLRPVKGMTDAQKKRLCSIIGHNAAFYACDAHHFGVEK
ncbi:MAG: hypothetical protein WC789_09560 [Lentisphaeria bacterium]